MSRGLILFCLLSGCRESLTATVDFGRPQSSIVSGTWVAQFGEETISDSELKQRFAEMNPYARSRFQAAEQRREYVEGLVRFELLAREAVRRKLYQEPEVLDAARKAMVQLLLKKVQEESGRPSDAELASYYQAHLSDYVKPPMVRLVHIGFPLSQRAQAEVVLREAQTLPPLDLTAFARLARQHNTDERTKDLDGDMRYLSHEELRVRYGSEIAQAASQLAKVGDVFPTLVETPTALHVLKLQARQQGMDLSFEQAKDNIVQLLANANQQERLLQFFETLQREARVQFNESALSAMTVDAKAPAVPGSKVQPGYVPAPPPSR